MSGPKTKGTPRVRPMKHFGRDGVLIQFAYDDAVLEQLKAMVPREARSWNAHRVGWWISDDYADVAKHVVLSAFRTLEVVDAGGESVLHTASGEKWKQERLL